jgi:hypothetical protein
MEKLKTSRRKTSSGTNSLDEAATQGIRDSSPLEQLSYNPLPI